MQTMATISGPGLDRYYHKRTAARRPSRQNIGAKESQSQPFVAAASRDRLSFAHARSSSVEENLCFRSGWLGENLAAELADELKLEIEPSRSAGAIRKAIFVRLVLRRANSHRKEDVSPGTFIAAVGADDEHKQEIDPALMVSCKIVADSVEQCGTIGDSHHAISQGLMIKENIYAELAEVVAGRKRGRRSEEEIIIFDSTGLQSKTGCAAAVQESSRCQ